MVQFIRFNINGLSRRQGGIITGALKGYITFFDELLANDRF